MKVNGITGKLTINKENNAIIVLHYNLMYFLWIVNKWRHTYLDNYWTPRTVIILFVQKRTITAFWSPIPKDRNVIYWNSNQVSISSTFFAYFFRTNVVLAAFFLRMYVKKLPKWHSSLTFFLKYPPLKSNNFRFIKFILKMVIKVKTSLICCRSSKPLITNTKMYRKNRVYYRCLDSRGALSSKFSLFFLYFLFI